MIVSRVARELTSQFDLKVVISVRIVTFFVHLFYSALEVLPFLRTASRDGASPAATSADAYRGLRVALRAGAKK